MSANSRTLVASIGFGILGAIVGGVWIYTRTLLPVFPPLNMGIRLPIAFISGLICYLLAYQSYARSGYSLGSVFGGLGGTISGAATQIGYLLSYVQETHSAWELLFHGILGAILGGFIGTILGFIFFPLLATVTKSNL